MERKANGTGSVTQRADGRWQGSIQLDGKRHFVYGRTKAEAQRGLLALQKQAAIFGGLPDPGKRTVADLLSAWLDAADLKATTREHHALICRVYIAPALGDVRLSKLTPERVQRFYQGITSPSVLDKVHRLLHRACEVAVLWRWLAENVTERTLRPAYAAKRKALWTEAELRTFLQETRDHWLGPLWALAIATGCRVGELLALTWADVDLGNGLIRVEGTLSKIGGEYIATEPKTPTSRRRVALPRDAMAMLRTQRARQAERRLASGGAWARSDLVFTTDAGAALCRDVCSHSLQKVCKRLGLTAMSMHGLRHLHASLLIAEGTPVTTVAARLGHADATITTKVYAHDLGRDQDAADAIGRAMSATG